MARHVDVCVVGSINLDVVTRVDRLPGPGETVLGHELVTMAGGKGQNQAMAAARAGAKTAFIGMVGDNAGGRELRDGMAGEGVDVHGIEESHAPTGTALIAVDSRGENS